MEHRRACTPPPPSCEVDDHASLSTRESYKTPTALARRLSLWQGKIRQLLQSYNCQSPSPLVVSIHHPSVVRQKDLHAGVGAEKRRLLKTTPSQMVSKYITTTTTTTTPGGDCGLRNAPPGPVDPGRRMKPATHGSARAGHLARRRQQSRRHGRGSDFVRVAASVSNNLLSMVGLRGGRRRSGKAFAAGGGGNGMFDPGGPGGGGYADFSSPPFAFHAYFALRGLEGSSPFKGGPSERRPAVAYRSSFVSVSLEADNTTMRGVLL